jgi:hypothetical protein
MKMTRNIFVDLLKNIKFETELAEPLYRRIDRDEDPIGTEPLKEWSLNSLLLTW